MNPYQQPRLMHDPYGQAHMDTRPRLQVKKRPVDRQGQDTMDDRSDSEADADYQGEGDDDEDDDSQE